MTESESSKSVGSNTSFVMLSRGLLTIAFVILLFYFVVYVVYAANLIRFPFDYDQGEGFELVDVLMFSKGQWPYADIEQYPFYGSIYPPLYHILLVPFAWLFGPEYWYGRLFSFVTTLIAAGAIGYAVWWESGKNQLAGFVGMLSGLAFLSSPIVYHIGPLFRQHIPMFMFEVLGVVVLAHANEIPETGKRRRTLLIGLALLIAAGYTKQLAAFTALAALAFVFLRNPRRGIAWGIGFALVGAVIFVFLTLATDGHWWTQTIVANVKDYFPQQARGLLKVFFTQHFWLLIPAVLMVIYELYFSRLSIYSIWFVAVTVLNANAAGTWGAGDSYYATSVAALCVLSGIFIARSLNHQWTFYDNIYSRMLITPLRRVLPVVSAMALLLPGLYVLYGRDVLHMPTNGFFFDTVADALNINDNTGYNFYDPDGYLTLAYAQIGHLTNQEDIDAGNRIVALMNEFPPEVPILSEEAGFSLRADRDVITNPVVLMILSWVNEFDSTDLVDMLESQEFGMIVLRAQFYPAEVLQAISENYAPDEEIRMNGFNYIIMRPR